MFRRNFLFGVDSDTANVIGVTASDIYQPGKGFGFVIEQNRREQELLKISELNAGFDTFYWYQDKNISHIQEDENGCFLDSSAEIALLEQEAGETWQGEERRIPLSFKVDVPREGNYRVTITIRTTEEMKNVLIYTGRRRLGFLGDIPANTRFQHTMLLNVCDIVPRGKTRIYLDKTIDITVVADRPQISGLQITEVVCPTIYIAGDSTVTDQSADYPYAPGTSYSGWGQMISAYLNEKIAVSNHAHSGLTTDSFRKEGHYAVIDQYSRPRDFFFYQFGHNDQKLEDLKARGGYQTNLLRYIHECRDKGAYPVIVTPISRNTWKGNDGSYNDLLEEYAESCKEVGRLAEVPVLDLHERSKEFILEKGLEGSKPYFFPNDYTHNNDYGAYFMAGLVAREIVWVCGKHSEPGYRFLAKCVTEGFGAWPPAEQICLPVKPKCYEDIQNPAEGVKILSEIEDLEKPADRASVLDMVIKTVRFFPTNVYNDMYTDVVGHEWYAGTVECAYQNGIIEDALVVNHCLMPEKAVTLEEFLIFAVNGYKSRRKLPAEKSCAYDTKCADFARPFVRAACEIGLLPGDGSADLQHILTRGEAVALCRKMSV